jgi:hypothetical protein
MTNDPLDGLTVSVPCTEPWEKMKGDDRRRYCAKCRLHVHDLSSMTRDEALDLLGNAAGGRTCVRFSRRPDGRVTTRDCRKAVRALRRRAFLAAAAIAGAVGLGGAALALAQQANANGGWSNPDLWDRQPFSTLARYLPASWLPSRPMMVMGDICPPPGWPPPPPAPPEDETPPEPLDDAALPPPDNG